MTVSIQEHVLRLLQMRTNQLTSGLSSSSKRKKDSRRRSHLEGNQPLNPCKLYPLNEGTQKSIQPQQRKIGPYLLIVSIVSSSAKRTRLRPRTPWRYGRNVDLETLSTCEQWKGGPECGEYHVRIERVQPDGFWQCATSKAIWWPRGCLCQGALPNKPFQNSQYLQCDRSQSHLNYTMCQNQPTAAGIVSKQNWIEIELKAPSLNDANTAAYPLCRP